MDVMLTHKQAVEDFAHYMRRSLKLADLTIRVGAHAEIVDAQDLFGKVAAARRHPQDDVWNETTLLLRLLRHFGQATVKSLANLVRAIQEQLHATCGEFICACNMSLKETPILKSEDPARAALRFGEARNLLWPQQPVAGGDIAACPPETAYEH